MLFEFLYVIVGLTLGLAMCVDGGYQLRQDWKKARKVEKFVVFYVFLGAGCIYTAIKCVFVPTVLPFT